MLKVIDLFCGAGGFSTGFKMAGGFSIIFGIDNNQNACKTFQYNFPEAHVQCSDIRNFDNFPDCDIIIGSPPCIEFSKGNIDRTFDDALIKRMIEIVEEVKPKYWIMENVEDANDYIKAPVKKIMTAYDYGCATIRSRIFAGDFPEDIKRIKGKTVRQAININRSGHQQPYKDNVYRKINPNKPFVTLCSQRISNERYLLPNKTTLTTSEMAIIQGFPGWFVFPCSVSEMQRQIGNSVCPPVAEAIAKGILKEVKDDK